MKALAVRSDDLSWIPGTHIMVEQESGRLLQAFILSFRTCGMLCILLFSASLPLFPFLSFLLPSLPSSLLLSFSFSETGWPGRNSLCRPAWLQTHRDLSASASQMLGSKLCTVTSNLISVSTYLVFKVSALTGCLNRFQDLWPAREP